MHHLLIKIALLLGWLLFGHGFLFEKLCWIIPSIIVYEQCRRYKWPAAFAWLKQKAPMAAHAIYTAALNAFEIGDVPDFEDPPQPKPTPEAYSTAVAALQTLGFKKQRIETALASIPGAASAEQMIKEALKYL